MGASAERYFRKNRKRRKELYRRWIKITCPDCGRRLTLPKIQKKKDANGTVDCYCGTMLLVKRGRARNFHQAMHEQTNGRWPADGAGTGYIEF